MSLESLIARLEAQAPIAEGDARVTPVTVERTVPSQEKPLQNNNVTPVTPISRDGNSDSSRGKGSGLPQPGISVGGLFELTSQTSQTSQPSPGAALRPVLAVRHEKDGRHRRHGLTCRAYPPRSKSFASSSASSHQRPRQRSCVAAIALRSLPTLSAMGWGLAAAWRMGRVPGRKGGGGRGRRCGRGRSGGVGITRELDYMYVGSRTLQGKH